MTPNAARLASLTVVALLAACASAPLPAQEESYDTLDGLERVESRRLDVVLMRPGVDYSAYSGVMLDEPELAFRTPNRAERQFPLAADQRKRFHDMLSASFLKELSSSDQPTLVEEAGPGVLRLKVRVQDIAATIPPRAAGTSGRASIALEAVAEATLVLELEDSETNEILARAYDTRAAEGIALSTSDGPVTRWEDIDRLCNRWATAVRRGLETLVSQ